MIGLDLRMPGGNLERWTLPVDVGSCPFTWLDGKGLSTQNMMGITTHLGQDDLHQFVCLVVNPKGKYASMRERQLVL